MNFWRKFIFQYKTFSRNPYTSHKLSPPNRPAYAADETTWPTTLITHPLFGSAVPFSSWPRVRPATCGSVSIGLYGAESRAPGFPSKRDVCAPGTRFTASWQRRFFFRQRFRGGVREWKWRRLRGGYYAWTFFILHWNGIFWGGSRVALCANHRNRAGVVCGTV